MKSGLCAIAVIPARAGSTRLPKKVLAPILGKPLVQYVWEIVARATRVSEALVATDSEDVKQLIENLGGKALMTPSELPSGTDRVAYVTRHTKADIIINVQGDEPLLPSEAIDRLVVALEKNPSWDIATLSVYVESEVQKKNPNVVKVVTTPEGRALFFSREALSVGYLGKFQKHIGVYAYRKEILERFCQLKPSPLEIASRLEQMRAMENGMTIGVVTLDRDTIAVDTEEDRLLVERHLTNAHSRDSHIQKERVL